MSGQSIWEEAKIVDFLGCSAHPSWHSTRFLQDRLHQSIAYFADLMKSSTLHKNGKFWVSELQGGTNIFSGETYLCPTYDDITHWMWEAICAGAKGIVFWCFNTRNSGFEAGEWGLLDQNNMPSERLEAATEVASFIKIHRELFANAKPQEPDIWLLYSENSMAMAILDGKGADVNNPRNKQMAADALCGAYLMCADLGLEVGFINEERLATQGLDNKATLIVPGAYALNLDTCKAIKVFVNGGGILIADGICGFKNEYGISNRENKEIIDEIFGATLCDVQSDRAEFTIEMIENKLSLKGWFIRCYTDENDDSNPAFDLRLKVLHINDDNDLVILLNTGLDRNAELEFSIKGSLLSLKDEHQVNINSSKISVLIKEKEVKVFLMKKS